MVRALALVLLAAIVPGASGQIQITEWMYNGLGVSNAGEFVELTNVGDTAVDLTGWSFDDNSQLPGTVDLSGCGIVPPGASVILTDETAADFATVWGLTGVTIVGGNLANLGRNDEINIFDAQGALVDRLAYGDESYPGTVRTQNASCSIPAGDYSQTTPQTYWVLSTAGDGAGSWASTRGEVGSPGYVGGGAAHAPFDVDADDDIDLADFALVADCLTGPAGSYTPLPGGCALTVEADGFLSADVDEDHDLDLVDLAGFAGCFGGDGVAIDPECGGAGPSGPTMITLNGTSITVDGPGVSVDGASATITAQGVYTISGTLSDGAIVVNSADSGTVELVLAGVNIANSTGAPLAVLAAGHARIVLADQSSNQLTDAASYVFPDPEVDEPNAALFSKDSLTILGTGALTVHGNYNDGIASKDSLYITGGTITVIAVDDGIRGKDRLVIENGDLTVTSGGDALKSDNAEDPQLGYIDVSAGTLHVTSGGDGLAAETAVNISGGTFTLTCGGGSGAVIPEDASAKAVKGLVSVALTGGTFTINAADDGVHSNSDVTIASPASLTIATHDDAVHADGTVHITGGSVTATTCYEGIEGGAILIEDGTIHLTSTNDAIDAVNTVAITGGNFTIVAGGGHTVTLPSTVSAKAVKGLVDVTIGGGTFSIDSADDGVHSDNTVTISGGNLTIATNSSTSASYGDGVHAETSVHITGGTINVTTAYEGIESKLITIDNGTIHVLTTDDGINAAGGSGMTNVIRINGGYVVVNAAGDGIDANGSIVMTGGTVIVHGPTTNMNGPIDYDGTFTISGGYLVAAGSAQMAQAPSTSSTQRSVKITYGSDKAAGTIARIQTTSGATPVLTFAPAKVYRSLVFSAPTLTAGTSFQLYRGGTCTGTLLDGLYTGGTYSGGTSTNTFTTNSMVTNVSAP